MEKHFPGVYKSTKKDGTDYYRSSITYHRKHISLGSYDSAVKAHFAYQEANMLLFTEACQIHDYTQTRILSFEKWVSLINLRDHQIYIANPIYLYPRYFEYYLTPSVILKFDIDDLFYYSEHKIMQRGRHFFIADYGMQTNIASRYGIKSYAVKERDYRFVNGDENDFRYENIEIINMYHGVSIRQSGASLKPIYESRIHVNGNFLIGRYDSAIKAAVAYNKAADILKKNGVVKNYAVNEIEELTPSAYAELYRLLPISSKIEQYHPHENA